jgi:hypothetical protein
MRPTGNWRPALAERLTAFLPLLPLPRPDMVARGAAGGGEGKGGAGEVAAARGAAAREEVPKGLRA